MAMIASAVAAWPKPAGLMSRARMTVDRNEAVSIPNRAITPHRTPARVAVRTDSGLAVVSAGCASSIRSGPPSLGRSEGSLS